MRMLLQVAALSLFASPLLAADLDRGARLHGEHCAGCHAERFDGDAATLYTRDDRKVRSLVGLKAQVERCVDNLGLDWGTARQADMVAYLNTNFYRF